MYILQDNSAGFIITLTEKINETDCETISHIFVYTTKIKFGVLNVQKCNNESV